MNIYNVNWSRFSENFLIIAMRKPTIKAWLKALFYPVGQLHALFLLFRQACLYRVQHNSQIAYMEAMLNDKFDPNLRRIRIANTEFLESIFLYEPEEQRDVFIYESGQDVFLHDDDVIAGEGVDFKVYVPPALKPPLIASELAYITKMSAEIEYYKLYSKNFKIVWIQLNI